MLNFSDVRRGSKPTFLFFARQLRMSFEHALQECQITGWQIMSLREVQPHLPEGYAIPEVRLSPGAPRVEKHPLAFVSYYDPEDMARKLEQLSTDPDILQWQNNGSDRLTRAYLRDDKWVKDPPPFYPFATPVAEENKAQLPGVRRGEEPTFLFLSEQDVPALEHYLENHGTTGWEITQDVEAVRGLLPDGECPDGSAVFVSYFHPEDMRRKLDEILSSEEIIAWRERQAAHAEAAREYALKWSSDPPPFPKTESTERPDRR